MKKLLSPVIFLCVALSAQAQGYGEPVRNLSDEEIRLVQAYRRDPEPFRRILYEHEARWAPPPPPERHHPQAQLGPRDIIDVSIDGGSVTFMGRNYAYDPVSFRIRRGEDMAIVFRRQRSSSETTVIVAYRADGLHFDIPEQRPGTQAPEHGYLIIGEDPRWTKGEPIEQNDKINAKFSLSKADHLTFHIRYASAR